MQALVFAESDKEREFEKEVTTKWTTLLKEEPVLTVDRPFKGYDDIFIANSLLSVEECDSLICAAEKEGFGTTPYPKDYRGNLRLLAKDEELTKALFARLQGFLPKFLEEGGQRYELVSLNPLLRLAKYYPPSCFKAHVDAYYDNALSEKSMYTVNIYLNGGEFQGGTTRFYLDDDMDDPSQKKSSFNFNFLSVFHRTRRTEVVPLAGRALIFRQPPAKSYLHDGDNVVNGIKYLMRTDVMYRKC